MTIADGVSKYDTIHTSVMIDGHEIEPKHLYYTYEYARAIPGNKTDAVEDEKITLIGAKVMVNRKPVNADWIIDCMTEDDKKAIELEILESRR